jgi:1-acyl-sn-glycerol-3-phosphate acyltransferase
MILPKIARFMLRLGGWTLVGGRPDVPQTIVIAAPHTSNWDGLWALTAKVALELDDVRFFGKQSLFWFPLGNLLRALGGIPLDRDSASSAVEQAVALFATGKPMLFGLAPEGTRSKREFWKSGFYRIALDANVPVTVAMLDFGRRRIQLGPTIDLTGDVDADLATIRGHYEGVLGCRPELASPIAFSDSDKERLSS